METIKKLSAIDYFNIISKIPRDSGKEDKMQEFLINFAKNHELNYYTDSYKNIIIYKNTLDNKISPVALQAHMDMCYKKTIKLFNLFKGNVVVLRKGANLFSPGGTLGADCGIGMAIMLELLDSEIPMNIECIFTTNAETTMMGAKSIDTKKIESKQMICFDGFQEGTLFTNSFCYANYFVKFNNDKEFIFNSPEVKTYKITMSNLSKGLMGYAEDYISTNKIMVDFLGKIEDVKINKITGGEKFNTIPDKTECIFTTKLKEFELFKILKFFYKERKRENKSFKVKCVRQINQTLVLNFANEFMNFIKELEQGVVNEENNKPVIIQNINEIDSEKGFININLIAKDEKLLKQQEKNLDSLCEKYKYFGDIIDERSNFVADEKSLLCEKLKNNFVGLNPLKEDSIYNFIEGGIFQDRIKNLDIVCLNPTILNSHTCNEMLSVASIKNTSLWLEKFFTNYNQ